jgi:hypothetical protein
MPDPAEDLIRRALGRRPRPSLGPSFAEEVLRGVAADERGTAPSPIGPRRWLAAAVWLLAGAASVAVLASLEWSSASRTLAWDFGLLLVPLAYLATLWPRGLLVLLAVCGGPALREPDAAASNTGTLLRERE